MNNESNRRDPLMMLNRLKMLAADLLNWRWRHRVTIENVELAVLPGEPTYGVMTPPSDAEFRQARLPLVWPAVNRYAWLRFALECPALPVDGGQLFLHGRLSDSGWNARNPQGIVVVNGRCAGGIDTAHHEVRLTDDARPGHRLDIAVLVWMGMEETPGPTRPFELVQLDARAEQFALDFAAAADTAAVLDVEDYRRYQLLDACAKAAGMLDLSRPVGDGFFASVPAAHDAWREAMAKIDLPADRPKAAMIGHGHLDLGWLWPVEASHFKALNTVINQLNIIDELGDHVFLWSQPQCWKWIQADDPATWQRICQKVRSGNWEASGGMWVEADTNVTGGESLIRQLLYGTRFLREHLGQEETLLWLPDVFGYSAALPQLLGQFGIEYFMTTKISWNEYNQFPWETFHWQGLDGSSVLTHFGSCKFENSFITYNVKMSPKAIHDGWRSYRAKNFSDRFIVSFGHGDGGGGPTRQEVQIGQRLGRMPGLPKTCFQQPREFFKELAEQARSRPLPTWAGELYLEFHRGTYTTEGRTKRGNRLCENMLHDAELLAGLALPLGLAWDRSGLDACWEKLLLNQFHDILPGSSIQAVYEQAERDYQWILDQAGEIRARAVGAIAAGIDTAGLARPIVLFNTIDATRTDPIQLPASSLPEGNDEHDALLSFPDGSTQPIQRASDPAGSSYLLAGNSGIGSIGWAACQIVTCRDDKPNSLIATTELLENAFWRIEMDGSGRITRLLDKLAGREVLAAGQPGNQLQLYRDRPTANFAWNIDYHDIRQPISLLAADRVEIVESGPVRAAVRCHYAFGSGSRLIQDIRVYRDIERIDFATWADWHEQDLLLKAAFAVEVFASEATFEIQFGHVRRPTHRNTSWDVARFEVPAQRWIDLSETGYGVSLLNDCKYGHDVSGNVMRISLLRGPLRSREKTYADQGEHRFTYSLLPHAGHWRRRTIAQAEQLNLPIIAHSPAKGSTRSAAGKTNTLPPQFSMVAGDNHDFVITAIKKAEDDDRLIVRGYESGGGRGPVTLRFGRSVLAAWRSRADERVESPLPVDDNAVQFSVRPFEVVTLKVR